MSVGLLSGDRRARSDSRQEAQRELVISADGNRACQVTLRSDLRCRWRAIIRASVGSRSCGSPSIAFSSASA
eukprot:1757954-Prymnesium_polylepis.1